MRTRRRPVLQDKTPGNTPQKPKATSAKPRGVPVVESKARLRRSNRGKHVEETVPAETADEEELEVVREIIPDRRIAQERRQTERKPPRRTARTGKGKGRESLVDSVHDVGLYPHTGVVHRSELHERVVLPVSRRERLRSQKEATRSVIPAKRRRGRNGEVISTHGSYESANDVDDDIPVAEDEDPNTDLQDVRGLPSPVSPTAGRVHDRPPLGSLPPSSFPVAQEPVTPEPASATDEESRASDAARAILNTPSPVRIVHNPVPAHSTPLGRLPPLIQTLKSAHGRQDNSIRKWNASVARAYSSLPPSSPVGYMLSDEPAEEPNDGAVMYAENHRPSDDDPFGLLATEYKLKTMRQHRVGVESSRAVGRTRAPLGTLTIDEIPSSVAVPDRLPTPIPSDDSHNIDDLYLDVDPAIPEPARVYDENHEDIDDENEDKENIPTNDYNLDENKENFAPPHLANDDKKSDRQEDVSADEEEEGNRTLASIAPLLLASAKNDLDDILEPSSSSASPSHALRTPHKHRSAHRRSPLPTPHFSDEGFPDSPFTAGSARPSASPSPIKPSAVRPSAVSRAAPRPGVSASARQPLATLELEEPEPEPEPQPGKVAGKKRGRAQVEESSEESDPRAAVRKLEALLPKRSKKARIAAEPPAPRGPRGGGGKARAAGASKGKGRENGPPSASESDENENMSTPPRLPARAARGRGRGRGRGTGAAAANTTKTTARGRARGRAAASAGRAASRGRSTSRGRPVSKGKGKERALEEVDPDEDEERMRKRQERIEYFRKLKDYNLEKEDLYVI